jgi:hypothetical protein
MEHRKDAEEQARGLPQPGNQDDPTKALLVMDGLYQECNGRKSEQDSEEDSCREGRAVEEEIGFGCERV